MKFSVRVESPVHVGTGESLSWLDYVLVGRTVHVLDWAAVMDAALLGCEDAAERLAEFTDRCSKALKQTGDALMKAPGRERSELLRKLRDETSPVLFARKELGNDVLARAMLSGDCDRYRAEYLGGRLDRRLEIRTQAKDGQGKPTIPASVLRGQIRTSLAHSVLSNADEELARVILQGGGGLEGWNRGLQDATPGRARFMFGDEIEAAVFRAPSGGQRNARRNDPRLDLMRFLRVSDPVRSRAELVVLRSSPYGLSRGGARGGEDARMMPLQPTVLEAIAEGAEFEFDLRVDTPVLRGAAQASGSSHPMVREPFWQLMHRVFGVRREEARVLSDAELEERMLSAVEVSLAGRMTALLARDRAWLDRMDAPKGVPIRDFMDDMEKIDGRLPLRIGFGCGLHSMTVLSSIETSTLLGEPLGRVLARAGLGLKPRERRERAELEKSLIEKARREASSNRGARPGLRDELLQQKRDPTQVPGSRRFTMDGGAPDLFLGFASLARGEMSDKPPEPRPSRVRREQQQQETRKRSHGKDKRRKPQRPPIPDRPANENEIGDLLKKFGPRF